MIEKWFVHKLGPKSSETLLTWCCFRA